MTSTFTELHSNSY